jgi:aminopeptidase N
MNEPIYLKDYTPPHFFIDCVDLIFEIKEEVTCVESRLVIKRNPEYKDNTVPLRLDGEALTLVSVKVDGSLLNTQQYIHKETSLEIPSIGESAIVEIVTEITPHNNTTLMGLYQSHHNLFTQCEAQGFRRITYYLDRPDVMARFTTTIIADKQQYPILLSNGNCVSAGQKDKSRHWVKWVDPFRKPSYLFALVAGKLGVLKDRYKTQAGREVKLEIYAEQADLEKCHYAMAALKKAMQWDEERFGLAYDLDTYMIVAVSDFNMGAMENKGLNIFNTKYVLASHTTATDSDFEGIDAVVAHEYFHNWTGNRVTCRDWFQLSLKEGLTVFRDQEFSSDISSRAVQRIQNVRVLREQQFAEDAGPNAHPVQPASYMEINNFYTLTIYEKGAEIVRMQHTLLGEAGFRQGMDLYFRRHDGQAVTCEDFVAAMQDANQVDLGQFTRWYTQAGTPELEISGQYDAEKAQYTLTIIQTCPPTPGQPEKLPFYLPFKMGLLDQAGQAIALQLDTEVEPQGTNRVLIIKEPKQSFTFVGIHTPPTPSLLREFSAPVRIHYPYTPHELTLLMQHDEDSFNRWEAANTLSMNALFALIKAWQSQKPLMLDEAYLHAFRTVLLSEALDPALVSLMLTMPSQNALFEALKEVDPIAIDAAHHYAKVTIAKTLRADLLAAYEQLNTDAPYCYDDISVARRSLKNRVLHYLSHLEDPTVRDIALNQYEQADNMTDRFAALEALTLLLPQSPLLEEFAKTWQHEALVMDKWFQLQATNRTPGALDRVKALMNHPAFSLINPNKVRALLYTFTMRNLVHFHAADGTGYAFAAEQILVLDKLNPQVASRLASVFNHWKKLEPTRRTLMQKTLQQLVAQSDLSRDVYEIVSKALKA